MNNAIYVSDRGKDGKAHALIGLCPLPRKTDVTAIPQPFDIWHETVY